MIETLTFSCLDGIAFTAQRNRLNQLPTDFSVSAGPLGPFIELMQLSVLGVLPEPNKISWFQQEQMAGLYEAMKGRRRQDYNQNRSMGFFCTNRKWDSNDTDWMGFCLAAQKAATAANFPRPLPQQFAAALEELVTNVYEHSNAAESGIAVFRAGRDEFEFVVADRGVGTLTSLKSCSEYSHLTDHGQALRLALGEGVSRHGAAAKRGNGFRPIFVGLANLNGSLRFRSGDHSFSIDGQKIRMPAKLAQKVFLPGFFTSVSCTLRG